MEWTEPTAGIEEGIVVTVFEVRIKEEAGVRKPEKVKSVGLVDKGANLNPDKDNK